MSGGVMEKSELLNVIGEVKARVQDKLGITDFPIPQFVVVGKQSAGKSRLLESIAGEQFNFISGTLGSRRPTILEFRHIATHSESHWFVRDMATNLWSEYPINKVMEMVGAAHEECGHGCKELPICVRLESPKTVDMQVVDLPGFRAFAVDPAAQALGDAIEKLDMSYMIAPRNTLLCVEEAGDAANMSTLARCRQEDPRFERTILVRNKLDKYYDDLTRDNITEWARGYGDIPPELSKFSMTLPHWPDGTDLPKPFHNLRDDMNNNDLQQVAEKGLDAELQKQIGFNNFSQFMETKIEQLFTEALGPVMDSLTKLKTENTEKHTGWQEEYKSTDPSQILNETRNCGGSFARALQAVMDGVADLTDDEINFSLEEELREFHKYHQAAGTDSFPYLPSEDFASLDEYLEYLKDEKQIGAFDTKVNGGAQFRRLLVEVEVFMRFSEISGDIRARDVVQARGISLGSLTWKDVVMKLLTNEAHLPLQRRVRYVAERLRYFFCSQKEATLRFMLKLENSSIGNRYDIKWPKHAKIIAGNEMMKKLVFATFDEAVEKQQKEFLGLFDSMLTSTFSNPWVFLKGATTAMAAGAEAGSTADMTPEERIPYEIQSRSGIEAKLSVWLNEVPTEAHEIEEAVDKVQMLVLKIYGFIRSQICDQIELFSESFFKLPLSRKLDEDMDKIDLSVADKRNYEILRDQLTGKMKRANEILTEVDWCIDRLQTFMATTRAKR